MTTPAAPDDEEEQPRPYAVRFTPRASRELIGAMAGLIERLEVLGDSPADAEGKAKGWHGGARAAAATLAQNPGRFAAVPDVTRRLRFEARRMLVERTADPNGPAHPHHLYHQITEAGDDGPLVTVFHVRHAKGRPLTEREAEALRGVL